MPETGGGVAGSRQTTSTLIVNAYSARNVGDAAIVLATADLLRGDGPVSVSTRHADEDEAFYARRGINVVAPVIPFRLRTPGSSNVRRAGGLALGLLLVLPLATAAAAAPRAARAVAARLGLDGLVALLRADRVALCGGGYLYSTRRRVNLTLLHMAATMRVASLAQRPVIMLPQSLGPLFKRADRRLVRWGLKNVCPIVVRDDSSRVEAVRTLASRTPVRLCPDVALHGWGQAVPEASVARVSDRPTVGIVAMDWTWAREVTSDALDRYAQKLATLTYTLEQRGIRVAFFGHSHLPEHKQDDLAIARVVADRARALGVSDLAVHDLREADALFAAFSRLDVVVGTRLHSCLIALCAGVPAVALAYQPKTTGSYRLLGLERLCRDVEAFSAEDLASLIEELLRDDDPTRAQVLAAVTSARERICATYGVSPS